MKIFALLVIAFAVAPARAATGWPDLSQAPGAVGGGEKDAAVIVGAEDYLSVEKVPGARQNADDWQAYLTGTLKVPADRVILLRDGEATLEKMRKYVAQAAASVEDGGTLWFVFIGHGAPAKDGKDALLVGIDAQQEADSINDRSLRLGELLSLLSQGKQAKTIGVLDACFSGRGPSGKALVAGLQPLLVVGGQAPGADVRTILMTAAKSDQFAGPLPYAAPARPAFSYLILGALRGWARDAKTGNVSAGAAVAYAARALRLAHDRTQTPELTAGDAAAVLSSGGEEGPDLAKIERDAAPVEGKAFTVTAPTLVPYVQVPPAVEPNASGFDWNSVDVDALEKYNAVVKLDASSDVDPAAKVKAWKRLAKLSKFTDIARARAGVWSDFIAKRRVAETSRKQRGRARDADWKKLSRLLALDVVKADDKAAWAKEFVAAYDENPGLDDKMRRMLADFVDPEDTNAMTAGIQWITVPAGSYTLPYENSPRSFDAFRMMKTPVTVGMYRACLNAGACPDIPVICLQGLKLFVRVDQPVVCMTADGAAAFAKWVGGRLPHGAEYLLAASSLGQHHYPWGDENPTCARAVMGDSKLGNGCGRAASAPVCSVPKGDSEQGFCDLVGNVYELTSDGYPFEVTYPDGTPAPGHYSTAYGQSFEGNDDTLFLSLGRGCPRGADGRNDTGFRVVRDIQASAPAP